MSLINFLDNKVFRLQKYCSEPEGGEPCSFNEVILESDFNLLVTFSFDDSNNTIRMASNNLTPCGNEFSIDLKGGEEIGNTQVWETDLQIISESPSCNSAETFFNEMLDIGCFENSHYGDIAYEINTAENTITFGRNTTVFGYDYMTLEFNSLSVNDFFLGQVNLIYLPDNPYINFSNLNAEQHKVEIFNASGQLIKKIEKFKKNTLKSSDFSKGLYFIRLSNLHNHQKIFKFLKY